MLRGGPHGKWHNKESPKKLGMLSVLKFFPFIMAVGFERKLGFSFNYNLQAPTLLSVRPKTLVCTQTPYFPTSWYDYKV